MAGAGEDPELVVDGEAGGDRAGVGDGEDAVLRADREQRGHALRRDVGLVGGLQQQGREAVEVVAAHRLVVAAQAARRARVVGEVGLRHEQRGRDAHGAATALVQAARQPCRDGQQGLLPRALQHRPHVAQVQHVVARDRADAPVLQRRVEGQRAAQRGADQPDRAVGALQRRPDRGGHGVHRQAVGEVPATPAAAAVPGPVQGHDVEPLAGERGVGVEPGPRLAQDVHARAQAVQHDRRRVRPGPPRGRSADAATRRAPRSRCRAPPPCWSRVGQGNRGRRATRSPRAATPPSSSGAPRKKRGSGSSDRSSAASTPEPSGSATISTATVVAGSTPSTRLNTV